MKNVKRIAAFGFIALVIYFQSCKKDNNKKSPYTFYGESKALGNGIIRSFVILGGDGKPQTIGLKFTPGVLSGLPTDTTIEHDTPVPLPSEAGISGIDHIEVDWNPVGHDPKPIYGLPHFDFHFYLITKAEQEHVVPGPDTVSVPALFIPQDYISGMIAVPDMGVHWIDKKAPEFNGQKFTDTFIYGFYHGQLTFVESMITTAYISSKPDFKIQIKQPQAFQKTGYYPTMQHIYFDAVANEFTMSLEGLTYATGVSKN
jgi:hypothetical protein